MKLNSFQAFVKPLKNNKEQYESDYVDRTEETFSNSVSYKEIWKNYDNSVKYGVRVVESSNAYRRDISGKKLIMPPNGSIDKGDYVHIQEFTNVWLVTGYDDLYQDRKTAFIQLCGESPLKWYDHNSSLQIWDCIIGVPNSRGGGYVTDRHLMTSLSYLPVVVQKNTHTSRISINQRFIFGSSVYRVTFIDDFSGDKNSSIIKLELTASETMAGDDFENGIAANPWNDNSYVIQISNNSIQDNVGATRTISAKTFYNDNLVDVDLVYFSEDDSIATVSDEGVISFDSVGSTQIKVSMLENNDVFAYADIYVSESITDARYITLSANSGTSIDNQNMTIETILQVEPVLTVSSWLNGENISDTYSVQIVEGSDVFEVEIDDNEISFTLYQVGLGKIAITDSHGDTHEYDVDVKTLF